MEEFLNHLYCGEIHPCEERGRYLNKMRSLERTRCNLLEELKNEIDEKSAELLQKYIDCQLEISFYGEQNAFAKGVGFAVKFLVSALD